MSDLTIDPSAAELEPEFQTAPVQVQETKVIFFPLKDFQARVNRDNFSFSKDVPQKIARSLANMLAEDPRNGYIRE